jgi:apolipoprotein N-acyltransferase
MLSGVHAIADGLVLLHGWRRLAVAFFAGALSVLAMPPLFLSPILWLTLPALVLLLDGADADPAPRKNDRWIARLIRPSFAVGWWFGFGYFLAGLYWIGEALLVDAAAHGWLIPFALTLIPGGLALFIALPCAIAGRFWSTGFSRVGTLASLLVIFEALRGVLFTGFPWNGFQSAFGLHDGLLQGLSVAGPLAASLLVLLVAMAPAGLWPRETVGRGSRVAVIVCLLALTAWTGYGAMRLAAASPEPVAGVAIRIVQPNIAQDEKWDPNLREAHVATLLELTTRQTGAEQLGVLGVSHVVWPESAFPFLLTQRPDVLAAIGQALPLGASLLSGAIRAEPRGSDDRVFYNSVYALNDRGEIVDAYDKVRLVPFGEQLPFAELIDRLGIRPLVSAPAGFAAGSGPDTLRSADGLTGLALVCYEAIFSGFVREGVQTNQPDYLLNVTNDAWFGSSAGPHQHFFQARLRSVETGLPLVRAANTGISAMVDSYGRVIDALEINQRGVIDVALPEALPATFYVRLGNAPFWLILALILGVSFYYQRKQKPVLA